MVKKRTGKGVTTTIAVELIHKDCKTCLVKETPQAKDLGACGFCASLVREVNGNGARVWVYSKPILDHEPIFALPKDLQPVPRLLMIE